MGQVSTGRISGLVTDPSNAAVGDATVTVTNLETAAARTVQTDTNGFYNATELPIGSYKVDVTKQGFKTQTQRGLQLVADGRITANFTLQIGNVSQSVEVVAAAGEQLNTVSGELSRVIDSHQVDNLTMNGRNYVQLMTLVPGAVVTNPDQFSVTTSLAANNQTINGNRADSNNLTVDGAYNSVAGSNSSLVNNVSPDFIEEVKLQTSNFSAEYGRFSGPAYNIITKSGTNAFHGGVFEFFRNDALDARNFFSAQKTELRFNNFGYDVGGPIRKDKLFFFVGEEWKRLRQQQNPTRFTVPSTALLNGNFAGQAQLFFPGTKTPIPGNNIASLITPDGAAIANIYRLLSRQSGATFIDQPIANNLTLFPLNPLNYREDIVRADYRINDNQTTYFRWLQDSNTLLDPFGTFSNGGILNTTPTNRARPGESLLLAHTWVISPTLVNEARVNATWVSQHITPAGNTWERSTYGFQFPQLYPGGGYPDGIPAGTITNYAGFQGPNFALMSPTTDISVGDTISIQLGAHSLKAGVTVVRDRVDQNGRPYYTGNLSFNTSGNTITTGNALADALLGNFRSYTEASSDPVGFFRFTQPMAFVQDSWNVNRKLKLELGVRYEYVQPMYTEANNMANFDQSLFNPAQAVRLTTAGAIIPGTGNPYNGLIRAGSGVPTDQQGRVPGSTSTFFQSIPAGAPRGLYSSGNTFGPRVGFAYQLNEKTVMRGGYGIFYNRPEGNVTFSQVNVPPILQITEFDNGNLSNPTSGAPANTLPVGSITAINPKITSAYVEQYSFSVQRELPLALFLETTYVGGLGRHLLRQPNINFPNLVAVAANPSFNTNYFNPYPGYTSIQQYQSDSTSNYHALQVFVSKRAGNVIFTSGYTWSKALGDSSGEGDNSENYQNRHFNYGPTSFDRRHAFVATFTWNLAQLRQAPVLVREVAGGWALSGVIRLQSGPYSTVTGNTSTGTRRSDYVGGVIYPANQNVNNWVNAAAFATAPNGRYGDLGINTIEGPGLQSYDLSLAKHFPIKERFDLRLQGDFFNAFNVANFSGLNTTITSTAFGTISSAYPPRQIQLALKLSF
ncbi:MAG TPA: carboxypeptidase regulatory-like domain-containing protein [Bryobacteraceae bacterium]|nr:carboxypeptidase regulatory-like domain-containing protein [Bryobacteraceae bacterium]